jgi:ribose 5-phosphate isomerase B
MTDKLVAGSDHAGLALRAEAVKVARAAGLEVEDLGPFSGESVDYPDYAKLVAQAVASGRATLGLLVCGTGIGMSIAANKVRGVRASLCTSHYMAKMTRQHNDSNVLCLGGKVTGACEMLDIVDAWLDNSYVGGRHAISLGLIADMEAELGLRVPEA